MSELDFTRRELDIAAGSTDEAILASLANHPSRYIRARVAGNPHTSRNTRDTLRENTKERTAVLLWLLGNPSCTREEYTLIFQDYVGRNYDGNVHTSLASCRHATTSELGILLGLNQWAVTMAVLNNYRGRNLDEYRNIIKIIPLPDEDLAWEKWSEIEKLAYLRTTGLRRPESNR